MSGHDLYADGFPPHGTTAGYAAGCHSSGACPGRVEVGQTCVEANQRYASEWGYRKAVTAGQELAYLDGETVAVVEAKKPASKPKPKARPKPPAPTPVAPDLDQWPDDAATEAEPISEPEPEPAAKPAEQPRPRGKAVLDDAIRTLAEAAELQRALAVISERALRTVRIEINHLRSEIAAQQSNEERS